MVNLKHMAIRIWRGKVDADEIQSAVQSLYADGIYSAHFIPIMDSKPATLAEVLPPFQAYLATLGISAEEKYEALSELLSSLTEGERDFIAGLDYGNDLDKHRAALDVVLNNDGIVNFELQGYWHPYEVIELGKNWLQAGHEREYTACMGMVLKNILAGGDTMNDVEYIVDHQYDSIGNLPANLRHILDDIIETMT